MDLSKYIRDIPDFPIQGIIFKDITPLLMDSKIYNQVIVRVLGFIRLLRYKI